MKLKLGTRTLKQLYSASVDIPLYCILDKPPTSVPAHLSDLWCYLLEHFCDDFSDSNHSKAFQELDGFLVEWGVKEFW